MSKDHDIRRSDLKYNLDSINESIPKKVNLVCVSKFKPITDIALMYELGARDFGENKVQELKEKDEVLSSNCPEINWHFIGSLQTNKINNLLKVKHLVSIHSIDSIKLLNKLLSKNIGRRIGLFLQVKTSDEDEKSGFESLEELIASIKMIKDHDDFYFQGLMTMGKIRTDDFEKSAKVCFEKLVSIKKKLSSELGIKDIKLSMGMSQDYEIAIKHGTDFIRVGSKLFGVRV